MKLSKLIPFASIASAAAITAPLVTSCACAQSFHYEFEIGETEFEPTIIRPESDGLKMSEATEVVLSEIASNKQILADELASNQYADETEELTPDFTNITYDIKIGNIDPASGRVDIDFTDIWLDKDEETNELKVIQKVQVEVQKMPMVFYHPDDTGWGILPLFSYVAEEELLPLYIADTPEEAFIECLRMDREWRINIHAMAYGPIVTDITTKYLWSSNETDLGTLEEILYEDALWLTIPPRHNVYLLETPLLPE